MWKKGKLKKCKLKDQTQLHYTQHSNYAQCCKLLLFIEQEVCVGVHTKHSEVCSWILVALGPCETDSAYQVILIIFKLSFFLLMISCERVCSWNESFSWSKSYRLQKHDAAFSSRTNKLSPTGKVYILWLFFQFESETFVTDIHNCIKTRRSEMIC